MKLISMTDFVLEQSNKIGSIKSPNYINSHFECLSSIKKYAHFLKQPLKLEMFVPIDDKGNVLEKPISPKYFDPTEPVPEEVEQEFYNYDKSKEKVLFEGLNIIEGKRKGGYYIVRKDELTLWLTWNKSKTIECIIHNNLTLTPSAIKQFNQ